MIDQEEVREPLGLLEAMGLGLGGGFALNLARRALFRLPVTANVRGQRVLEHGRSVPDLLTILAGLPAGAALHAASVNRWRNELLSQQRDEELP